MATSFTPLAKAFLPMDTQTRSTNQSWYALRVGSRFENTVARHLNGRDHECFLPLYKCRRRWSDRIKEIELPLFPGYVFCKFDPLNRLPILSIPGVVNIVGVRRVPLPVNEDEIAAIQTAVKSGLPTQPWPFLQIGQRVRIEYGPLCGVEGILLGFRGRQRLVLSVTLLQRSVAVQVDESWVQAMPNGGRSNAFGRSRITDSSNAVSISQQHSHHQTWLPRSGLLTPTSKF
jgi:transcription antitermination factor NusG